MLVANFHGLKEVHPLCRPLIRSLPRLTDAARSRGLELARIALLLVAVESFLFLIAKSMIVRDELLENISRCALMMVCKSMLRAVVVMMLMIVTDGYVLLAQKSQQQKAAEPSA